MSRPTPNDPRLPPTVLPDERRHVPATPADPTLAPDGQARLPEDLWADYEQLRLPRSESLRSIRGLRTVGEQRGERRPRRSPWWTYPVVYLMFVLASTLFIGLVLPFYLPVFAMPVLVLLIPLLLVLGGILGAIKGFKGLREAREWEREQERLHRQREGPIDHLLANVKEKE